ncbi:MAG: hypothetical protein KatS3mg031_2287 [Chitinophagales bacterium]|nr:MAG: hypothetical protein KatS3mg031_2287 [Chitinophagales bacterium]
MVYSRILFLVLILVASSLQGQEVQFGLSGNPLISWMKSESGKVDKGKVRAGIEYGLAVDVIFKKNYILSTGITADLCGGNLIYNDSLPVPTASGDSLIYGANARFKLQYVNIPVIFKMRTNEIGRFRYYGGLGLVPAFRVKSNMDLTEGGTTYYDNANIRKVKDDTNGLLVSNIFNLSMHVEAGLEYPFSDNTALRAGVFYRNGFLNVISDNNDDSIVLNYFAIAIGVLF